MKTALAAAPAKRAKDNERPLVEDIRFLGRILGDVIREQDGGPAYELIENIRKLSVAFRRDADHESDKALKKLLKSLSADQTVSVIRAFTYFSHLANLAEDRHHIRRRAVHERAGESQEGSGSGGGRGEGERGGVGGKRGGVKEKENRVGDAVS